ncbi:SulP family inorganic anion transporter [Flavihumibacter fluvii]|uniref:SulP family inorganic anion transporter n=1 Tax=Flavihumibacter fluvii TaxID=2838157 RepID=UPI001BDE5D08|nr:SulP family inorganic anion transporter [Flavihumibacter fluvii]ULQ53057.1 SulP family inorganic anion transporter [Flavihumibacter fluvii]
MFRPKLIDTLKQYDKAQLYKDLTAGIIVGIVALPLAIAFAIASGVSPEKGLITAVVAGFIISVLGGSKVQIGGPTGAFIVVVYGIVVQYGENGLVIATIMAGILLIIMGLTKMGTLIKFIPHPLITGFTTGIALIILTSVIKDFFGLTMGVVPADFIDKWIAFSRAIPSINPYAILISATTVLIILFWPRITYKIPGSLIAIILTTVLTRFFPIPVETISGRYGTISANFTLPHFPDFEWATIQQMVRPAFTIAMLAAIESLLSAVVADGMIGGNHRSNTELIAQGTANVFSAAMGGIPATGAIARTATNVKNGARTPVAGIIHALTLLCIVLVAGKWAGLIPMATLAGILVVVAYDMSEWKNFLAIAKGSRSDAAVLISTFLLTVLVDLTVAIEIGMVLAAFLFMRNMTKISSVEALTSENEETDQPDNNIPKLPPGVELFEINGPMFFGAAYKFKDAIRAIEKKPKALIIRMRNVPIIDATGINILRDVHASLHKTGTKLILAEVISEQVMSELKKSRLLFAIGKANVLSSLDKAVERTLHL